MKNPIKTFDPNLSGRDFCIGDLHGSFSAYENLTKNLNFNPSVDRMFSVGDLVDRGPNSLDCLSLLHNPWFHSVLANHEKMMLSKFAEEYEGAYWFQNGGEWGAEAWAEYNNPRRIPTDNSLELYNLLPLVEELPFLITVNTKSGKKFHILHAELPSATSTITDEILADPVQLLQLATTVRGDGYAFLWARNLFYNFFDCSLSDRSKIIKMVNRGHNYEIFNDKLSHIISGHTIVRQPLTIVGQTNIDTGAYNSYTDPDYTAEPPAWAGLTCIELDTWKFYTATETTFSEVDPVVITREDLDREK